MRKRRGFSLFLLALAIATASIWFNDLWISYQDDKNSNTTQSKLSYYFTQFSMISTDANGSIEYNLVGKHFSHWTGRESSEIVNPQLTSFSSQKESTNMTAEKAVMLQQKDNLELQGSVNIRNFSSDSSSVLKTDLLRYHSKERLIETDSHVTLTSDSSIMSGKGMDSKLDENTLRIHSNVLSTFKKK